MRWENRSIAAGARLVGALVLGLASIAMADEPATQPAVFFRGGQDEVWFNQGRLDYYSSQYPAADVAFRRCIIDDAHDAPAYYYLGLTLSAEDKPRQAVEAFSRALQQDQSLAEARAGRASAFIKIRNYPAATADINALAIDPQWAETAAYLRGQLAYGAGDYQSAASSFSRAKRMGGSDAAAAGLYEGLSYIQLKELSRAQAALRDVARVDRDSSTAAAARAMNYSLDADGSRPFSLQLGMGYEYDSNVPLVDRNSPLPPGTKRKQDGRFVFEPQASFSLIRTSNIDAGIDTTDYFNFQNLDSNYDVASYQVGAFATYHFAKNAFAGVRYDFNDVELGHDPFLRRNVVTPQVTFVEPKLGYTSVYYQFEARQFNQAPPTSALDRDGKANVLGIIQGIDLTRLARANMQAPRLEVGLRYENDQTSGSDYDGNFFTLSGAYFMPICRNWTGDAGLDLSYFGYSNANSLDVTGRSRDDYEARFRIGATWQACTHVALRGDYTFTYHGSNVDTGAFHPYAFNDHQVGVRVIFTY